MSWVNLIVLGILIWCAVGGFCKGFLRVVVQLVQWLLMFVIVIWATPFVNTLLIDHTSLQATIQAQCEEQVQNYVDKKLSQSQVDIGSMTSSSLFDGLQGFSIEGQDGEPLKEEDLSNLELDEESKKQVEDMLSQLQINGADVEQLQDSSLAQEQLSKMGITVPESILKKLQDTTSIGSSIMSGTGMVKEISTGMTNIIMKAIAFVISYAIVMLIFQVVFSVIGVMEKIPGIGQMNRGLGLAVGIIEGFVIVWAMFALITFASTTPIGMGLVSQINHAPLLKWLYTHNLVLTLIMKFI